MLLVIMTHINAIPLYVKTTEYITTSLILTLYMEHGYQSKTIVPMV